MGLAHSPRIVTDGLVLALDAGNVKSNSEIDIRWNNAIAGATKTSSVGVITCTTIHTNLSSFFAQKYSSCEITGSTVWDKRPPTISEMGEVLSGNLTCKSHQTGTYSQVQYLFGGYPNAGDCCTLRFTGFGVGALIGVGGYFASTRQCKLTGDLRNSPVTITSPTGGFADPIVLTSDPADIKFTSVNAGGSDPWYVYWLGPYNQVPYSIRSIPGYVTGATYSSDGGGSIAFDGSNQDYVLAAANPDLNWGTGDFTVEMWVNVSSSSTYGTLFSTEVNAQEEEENTFVISMNSSLQISLTTYSTVLLSPSSATQIPQNTWKHIVVTRKGTTLTLYIDKSSAGTATSSVNYVAGGYTIGALPRSLSNTNLTGKVSNVRVYKGKALTLAEIEQNYNATKGRYA